MTQHTSDTADFDVLGIGNAIVDLIATIDDAFLSAHGIVKSGMHLIDEQRAETLYNAMGPVTEMSGGSAANTIAGLASLGGKGAFIGKVKNDALGRSFTHDIRAVGVAFNSAPATDGPATARSFILVTPDGHRTMNTYLGACQNLSPEDVSEEAIARAKIIYLEGYLWDPPQAKLAFRKAAELAHQHKRRVALTLSDTFCVDRYRDEFLGLMRDGLVDIVFANESELKALYQSSDFDAALELLRKDVKLAAVTRSEHGCVIIEGAQTVKVKAMAVDKIVDTTGAGDLFAAGFLFGLTQALELKRCGALGVLAAAEIISHLGARPQADLRQLALENGLI